MNINYHKPVFDDIKANIELDVETDISNIDFQTSFSVLNEKLKLDNVPEAEINELAKRIANGKDIAFKLLYSEENEVPQSSYGNSLDLALFLWASGYQEKKQAFARGIVRLYNFPEEKNEVFRQFFLKTLDNKDKSIAYPRISTHFSDMRESKQVGVDFGKGFLSFFPELSTMLCGCLKEKGFFIKFETAPWSPTKNPKGSMEHAKHYVEHKKSGGGEQVVGGIATARETDGQEEIRSKFETIIKEKEKLEHKTEKKIKKNVTKELKDHKRIFQMNIEVEKIKQKIAEAEAGGVVEVSEKKLSKTKKMKIKKGEKESLLGDNDKISKKEEKKTATMNSLKEAIRAFEEQIATVPHPDRISGREALIDIQELLPK